MYEIEHSVYVRGPETSAKLFIATLRARDNNWERAIDPDGSSNLVVDVDDAWSSSMVASITSLSKQFPQLQVIVEVHDADTSYSYGVHAGDFYGPCDAYMVYPDPFEDGFVTEEE